MIGRPAASARLLLVLWCCLYMGGECCGFSQNSDPFQMKLFSDLQNDEGVCDYLYPYPVGVDLNMMCQVQGSKPSWWEWDQQLCSNSNVNRNTGISSVGFHVHPLTAKDHSRRLTCTSNEKGIKAVTVALYVVDKMPVIEIHHIKTNNKEERIFRQGNHSSIIAVPARSRLRFSCRAKRMDPALKLCWFRGDKLLGCQTKSPKSAKSMGNSFHVEAGGSDANSTLVCKPQLRQEPIVLKAIAHKRFEDMFNSVRREVDITFTDDLRDIQALQDSMTARGGGTPDTADDLSNEEETNCNICGPLTCEGARTEQSYCLNIEVNSLKTALEDGRGKGFLVATVRSPIAGTGDTDERRDSGDECDHKECEISVENFDNKKSEGGNDKPRQDDDVTMTEVAPVPPTDVFTTPYICLYISVFINVILVIACLWLCKRTFHPHASNYAEGRPAKDVLHDQLLSTQQ